MKKLFLLFITGLILLASCSPYVPPVVSSVCVFNETGHELRYRIYRADSEIVPSYREWNAKKLGYIRLDPETVYRIDAYLIGPEKEVIQDPLIYKAREIVARTSFTFEVEHEQIIDFTLTYEDGVIKHTTTEH